MTQERFDGDLRPPHPTRGAPSPNAKMSVRTSAGGSAAARVPCTANYLRESCLVCDRVPGDADALHRRDIDEARLVYRET